MLWLISVYNGVSKSINTLDLHHSPVFNHSSAFTDSYQRPFALHLWLFSPIWPSRAHEWAVQLRSRGRHHKQLKDIEPIRKGGGGGSNFHFSQLQTKLLLHALSLSVPQETKHSLGTTCNSEMDSDPGTGKTHWWGERRNQQGKVKCTKSVSWYRLVS